MAFSRSLIRTGGVYAPAAGFSGTGRTTIPDGRRGPGQPGSAKRRPGEYLSRAAGLRELLTEAAGLEIDRYELPNLLAVNFVIHGLLAPGVSGTTRPDAQAKGLGEYLRSRLVPVPADLLQDARPPSPPT